MKMNCVSNLQTVLVTTMEVSFKWVQWFMKNVIIGE